MALADDLRARLAVAELEEHLVRLKEEGSPEELAAVKDELRYARWVQRGGPAEELQAIEQYEERIAGNPDLDTDPLCGVSNRAVAKLLERWRDEQGEG